MIQTHWCRCRTFSGTIACVGPEREEAKGQRSEALTAVNQRHSDAQVSSATKQRMSGREEGEYEGLSLVLCNALHTFLGLTISVYVDGSPIKLLVEWR